MFETKVNRPIILTFVHYYLPGYKSGGPVRTIANMVEHFGDSFEFKIVTSDRDAIDTKSYPEVEVDRWNRVGKAQVYYLSSEAMKFSKIEGLINKTEHDLLYLNSFFDPTFTLKPLLARKLKRVSDKPVVLAPRGEFAKSSIKLKIWKKWPFLKFSKMFNLYNDITWQASSEYEKNDIVRELGNAAKNIVIASNLPPLAGSVALGAANKTKHNMLKVVFLSRITPKKNLNFALRVLTKVNIPLEFHIYGPIRDENYWQLCLKIIDDMPGNIKVKNMGAVEHHQVPDVLSEYDLFFLPTQGENYGHVIPEAMAAGTPVLIANTTPWRNLEDAGVGWDLPLSDEDRFIACIEQCASITNEEYTEWRKKTQDYARVKLTDSAVVEANKELFLKAIESK